MTSIVHLYGALGALNQGLKSRALCTGVTCTKQNLRLIEALYKYGLISHYHFPTNTYLNERRSVRPHRVHSDSAMIKRRITVFFRWGFFDCGVRLVVRSRPGHRRFVKHDRLHNILAGTKEMFFLSTSVGVISASEAYNLNLGGEILFSIRH